jgi:hypothetical protein
VPAKAQSAWNAPGSSTNHFSCASGSDGTTHLLVPSVVLPA